MVTTITTGRQPVPGGGAPLSWEVSGFPLLCTPVSPTTTEVTTTAMATAMEDTTTEDTITKDTTTAMVTITNTNSQLMTKKIKLLSTTETTKNTTSM